jgi:lipopolysaccharide transport system permease protein
MPNQEPSCQDAILPHILIRPNRSASLIEGISELWQYRELLGFLAWRDVKLRYRQTFLGVAWAILQPLAAMLVFTVFFHRLAGISAGGRAPYPLWSYAGLLAWNLFAQSLQRCSESVAANDRLVSKVYFPRLVIPCAAALSAVIDFLVSLLVYGGLMVYYGAVPGLQVLMLPAFLALAMLSSLGVGLWLSSLNVRYRDVRYVIPFLVQLWMFVTPVVYPASLMPEGLRVVYGLNPMVGVVEGFRWCLLGEASGLWAMVLTSILVSLALLMLGAWRFRSAERGFADYI